MWIPKIINHHWVWAYKNKKMSDVDHFMLYLQIAIKCNTFYIHHPGQQFAYTPTNGLHQTFSYYF